jgi:hypothetical protein
MGVWYCSREDVKGALDVAETARVNAKIDREIEAASRGIETLCHRRFAPTLATRYKAWPDSQQGRSYRVWLDQDELIQAPSAIVSGGHTLDLAHVFLEPANFGPPFDRIEIDLSSSTGFDTGSTHQHNIAITGMFGYSNEEDTVGALSANLAASLTATASATWTTARIGVGDVLRIDNERTIVTEKTMVDSTQTLLTPIGATAADVTIAVTNGAAFVVDTVLLLDSERMLVVDIAENNLTVKRAWDGSVLATHSGSAIYTLTGVQLDRAQLGTTLAAHLSAATIYKWRPPGPVRQLAIAEALNSLEQESSAYARVVGSGDSARPASGAGLADLRESVNNSHGRKARIRVI